ncbi:MAG: PAS domain-containing protein [Planctomycetaceae bacterium]
MGKSLPQPAGNSRWARWINNSTTPMFLIDRDRRLQLFNLGCTLWTGWPADDVIARVCDYVAEPDSQSREAVLSVCAPPPEVWQGRPVEIDLWLPHRSEPPRQVRIRFQPLLDAEGRTAAVWGEIAQADAWIPGRRPLPPGSGCTPIWRALRQAVYRRYGDDGLIARTLPCCGLRAASTWRAAGGPSC